MSIVIKGLLFLIVNNLIGLLFAMVLVYKSITKMGFLVNIDKEYEF